MQKAGAYLLTSWKHQVLCNMQGHEWQWADASVHASALLSVLSSQCLQTVFLKCVMRSTFHSGRAVPSEYDDTHSQCTILS